MQMKKKYNSVNSLQNFIINYRTVMAINLFEFHEGL